MSLQVTRLVRGSPAAIDACVALACAAASAGGAVASAGRVGTSVPVAVTVTVVSCAPLLVRSRYPVATLAGTVGVATVGYALTPFAAFPALAALVALFTIGMRTDRGFAWMAGICSIAIMLTSALIFHPQLNDLQIIAWPALAIAVGDTMRSRRELLASALERAERAEQTKEAEARQRVAEERMRIARDLHDVVAHHITLVNAQAGVAHHLTDPELAYQALERIRDTSREALDELRTTVSLLRDGDDSTREPAPGVSGLEELVASFGHVGLDASLLVNGSLDRVPPLTGLTAYRIVQEALTNTHKHAGPAAASVVLTLGDDKLNVVITDDGAGSAVELTGGYGMIGMRERAKAVGGALTAGPSDGGGFRVEAVLPL